MQFSAVLDPPGKAAGLDPRFSWCTVGVHVCFHDPVQLGLDHSIKTLLRVGPSLPLSEELKKKKNLEANGTAITPDSMELIALGKVPDSHLESSMNILGMHIPMIWG